MGRSYHFDRFVLTSRKRSRIIASMIRLERKERARIIHLLCEGMSIRAISRATGVSKTTITKLVVDAGSAAAWYQDRVFHNLMCKRLQVDEIWGFVGSKAKHTKAELKASGQAGDAWLWMATDAETKIVPCWHVGSRDGGAAMEFIDDLASRLAGRVQITSDGHRADLAAIDTLAHYQAVCARYHLQRVTLGLGVQGA